MEARNQPFTDILGGSNRQFIIPVFQRDYSWTREQCGQLWNDVLRTGAGKTNGGHFTGSIVYIEADHSGAAFQRWFLIDGQQRVATLTLLLIALRNHISKSGWSGDEDSPTTEEINDCYLKNVHKKGEHGYRLVLRRKDDTTLRMLLDGTSIAEFDDSCSELIVDAYRFFRSALQKPGCDLDEVYRGISRLNVVDVRLDRNVDNPQMVFESMNSTGVDLRQSDLVRNYLLMGLDASKQERLYADYWSTIESLFQASANAFDSFLRDYIALERNLTKQIRRDRVYDEFKVYWRPGDGRPLEELLQDMVRVARRYASFLGIGPRQQVALSEAMSHMRALNTTQALLVMRLYDCHERGELRQYEFISAVELVESYLLRRAVLGLQTGGYWSVFARVAHSIGSQSAFDSFQVALARLRDNNRFPTNEEFKRGLEERDLYSLRVCKHVLDRLENAGYNEPSPVQDYSIEHIMPKEIASVPDWQEMLGEDWEEIHGTWLHRLGNLTLTAYNSQYGNRAFHVKQTVDGGFQQSAVRLNEYVRKQTQWTEVQMETRGRKLIERALEIWPFHSADKNSIQEADVQELKTRAAERDATSLDLSEHVRELLTRIQESIREFGVLIEVIERKSVCCYAPSFFAELLPMANSVRVILPLELGEVDNPSRLSVHDASTWHFVPNRVHTDCDVLVDVWHEREIAAVTAMIRLAWERGRGFVARTDVDEEAGSASSAIRQLERESQ